MSDPTSLARRLVPAALLASALLSAPALPAAASDPGLWRHVFGWGSDPLRDKYEELFDAKYPAHGYDPFNRAFPFEDVRAFDRAFDRRTAGVSRQVVRTDKEVTLTVDWPGSAERGVDVDVRRGMVRLAPSRGAEATGKYRFRAAMSEELELEVPAEAVEKSARVTRQGDRITLVFDREARGRGGNLWVEGTRFPEPEIPGGLGAPEQGR